MLIMVADCVDNGTTTVTDDGMMTLVTTLIVLTMEQPQ